MSAIQVAELLRRRAFESQLSHTEISRKAHISRQTWYRLLNAEVGEAKLSTVVGVCRVLNIDPVDVMGVYFGRPTLH
ncbi:MAG: helix-turn-helix transcriptional regulator [Thiolinea sp.]